MSNTFTINSPPETHSLATQTPTKSLRNSPNTKPTLHYSPKHTPSTYSTIVAASPDGPNNSLSAFYQSATASGAAIPNSPYAFSSNTPKISNNSSKAPTSNREMSVTAIYNRPRKAPSATTRDVDNYGEGLLYEKLQQREENLAEEKRKLELAKLKLHADFEELERERKALEEEENEINGFNEQMMKDQTELGRQSLYLQKMAADLKKQVEQAQMELEGLQKNEKKDDQKCQKMIASQQIRVDKLCELMNLMNNEILSTENDVIQMELAALDHKKLVEEAENFKQQIDLRRMKAINKKNQLLELSSQRNAKMSKMEASFDSVKKRLIDAQTERDRLNKIMAQCEARENELNERKDDLNQRQKNLEQKQKDRIQLQQNIRDELEQRQRDLAEHPIDPNFDLHTLEEEVIKEETELSEKVAQFEAKNNQTLSALNEKKEKLTQDIENIKGHINGGKSLEDLMKELKEAQAECSNSKKIMETRQREIEELREKVLSEADISNKNKEIQLESRRIITLEREVNNLQSKVQVDEEAIENDEEAFNETRNEIESETKMIALKEEASNKMLFLYKGQLEQATERYKNLVQQIEKYNANF